MLFATAPVGCDRRQRRVRGERGVRCWHQNRILFRHLGTRNQESATQGQRFRVHTLLYVTYVSVQRGKKNANPPSRALLLQCDLLKWAQCILQAGFA